MFQDFTLYKSDKVGGQSRQLELTIRVFPSSPFRYFFDRIPVLHDFPVFDPVQVVFPNVLTGKIALPLDHTKISLPQQEMNFRIPQRISTGLHIRIAFLQAAFPIRKTRMMLNVVFAVNKLP